MKRLVLPTVFFFLLSLALPQPSDALVGDPSLYIIPAASIGVALLPVSTAATVAGLVLSAASISGSTYYAATGQDPVYAAANSIASAADTVFIPAFNAFSANFVSPETFPSSAAQYVGIQGSVGASIGAIKEAVDASDAAELTALKALIAANSYEPFIQWENLTNSSVFDTSHGPYKPIASWNGSWGTNMLDYISNIRNMAGTEELTSDSTYYYFFRYINTTTAQLWRMQRAQLSPSDTRHWCNQIPVIPTSLSVTLEPNPGAINHEALKEALANPSPQVKEELKEAVKSVPDENKVVSSNPSPSSVPAPSQTAITNEQVNNFFTQNTSNVYNEYNNIANNASSTYNDIEGAKAAAELAKEQEEAEKKEETFSPIASSAFEEPYDPGPYDIPERFSSFLNTVKSSGLFSFSSSFFNSLPGGGSPVYQIEAGQYGSHTIDLSQTMSIGLAVLKTILLACFGFLSIRAVIMKR